VNGTGTNLKSTTKNIETPRNHKKTLNKKGVTLLIKLPDCFFAEGFGLFDVIFVAIILEVVIFIKIIFFATSLLV
jgi:hypothetical protein